LRTDHTRVVAGLASLALAAGFGAGCGDDTTTEAADASQVTVTAKEFTFDLSTTPTADTQEIAFDNAGELPHAMVFARINEGFTTEEAIKLEGEKGSAVEVAVTGAKPGQQKPVKVKQPREAGEDAMRCPTGSAAGRHAELGQWEEFSIE
jgi:hypothetical protein